MLAIRSDIDDGDGKVLGNRRRVAIAFADVVGYSTLMASDERGTYERWMALLSGVVEPEVARRGGRIVDMAGDGVLTEFSGALDAVEWARNLQRNVRAVQEAEGAAVPIALRIAVHVGEVFAAAEGRIFGDAVNFAARLQSHAVPGGIVVSEAARDALPAERAAEARDLGLLDLKGFERPARAYAFETEAARVAWSSPRAGGLPSLAVLPFANLVGDPADEYFSDGLVEDIALSLAGLHELFVINRASALMFRGRQPDPREVRRTLGARYVLTGSVRRASHAVRVSVQLCDADNGATLWGDRMEAPPGGIFDVQDEIVRQVVAGLVPSLRASELRRAMRKRPDSLTAYDHMLRALQVMGSVDPDTFERGRGFLRHAMAEDPGFALPVAWAARWHSLRIGRGWSSCPAEDAAEAMSLASRAVALDRRNALALATFGHLKTILHRDSEGAMECFDEALAACPNSSLAWTLSSATQSYLGNGAEAVRRAERGMRLSPFDPLRFSQRLFLAIAHYASGDHEQAVHWTSASLRENPLHAATLKIRTGVLAAVGRMEEARAAAAHLLAVEPGFRLGTYARTRQPFRHPELEQKFLGHLRQAGLPE